MKDLIVFFDGNCGLCNGAVKRIIKMDKNSIFSYAPLDGETAKTCDIPNGETIILYNSKTSVQLQKTAALREIVKLTEFSSVISCILNTVPLRLSNIAYDFVAKIRYRVFGTVDYCEVGKTINFEVLP